MSVFLKFIFLSSKETPVKLSILMSFIKLITWKFSRLFNRLKISELVIWVNLENKIFPSY